MLVDNLLSSRFCIFKQKLGPWLITLVEVGKDMRPKKIRSENPYQDESGHFRKRRKHRIQKTAELFHVYSSPRFARAQLQLYHNYFCYKSKIQIKIPTASHKSDCRSTQFYTPDLRHHYNSLTYCNVLKAA